MEYERNISDQAAAMAGAAQPRPDAVDATKVAAIAAGTATTAVYAGPTAYDRAYEMALWATQVGAPSAWAVYEAHRVTGAVVAGGASLWAGHTLNTRRKRRRAQPPPPE